MKRTLALHLLFEGISLSIEENKQTLAELQIRELCVMLTKHAFDTHVDITLSELAFQDRIRSRKEGKDAYFVISKRLNAHEEVEASSSKQLIYISINDINRSSPLFSSSPSCTTITVDCGPLSGMTQDWLLSSGSVSAFAPSAFYFLFVCGLFKSAVVSFR